MFPALFGLITALLFALLAHGVYGSDGIMNYPWIDLVFWSLIGAGAAISMVNTFGVCLPCKLLRSLHVERWGGWWCSSAACQ